MLKKIPKILSPLSLKYLCEMGHGDTFVIADANFPSYSIAKSPKMVIDANGSSGTEILKAVLELFPLDTYVKAPVNLMEKVKGDDAEVKIWDEYKKIINEFDKRENIVQNVERFAFYEKAKDAYFIIHTGESRIYANLILQKGVI